MIWKCIRIGRRKEVRAFVSFNPIPYGLFGWIGAKLNKKAIHFGFIGLDWNHYIKKSWGRVFLAILRRGDLVTVPGESMRQEMLKSGFDAEKITVMPHSTDIERYEVSDAEKKYCCIYAGELSRLKQVDIIIRAFAKVLQSRPQEKLCIAGDGPQRKALEALTEELGITANVEFAGHVDNVSSYLAAARIIVIASTSEGFPSAMVEGMCCGLVPVSAPVGAIPDIITDGENGLLFENSDAGALAECIDRLIDDQGLYDRLREKVIEQRLRFSHEAITPLWDKWLGELYRK
jgi:glycosyltransferase involved in cell wall biosynthesis